MRCSKAKDAISRWMDGELAQSEIRAVQEHMDRCRECAAFKADLERQVHLVREAIPQQELTEGLVAEILAGHRLQRASQRLRAISAEMLHPYRRYLRWAVCAAAAAFAIVSYLSVGEARDVVTGDLLPTGGMIWMNMALMGVAGIIFLAAPQAASFDTWLIGKIASQEIRWPSPYKVVAMRSLGLAGLVGCCVVHYLLLTPAGMPF